MNIELLVDGVWRELTVLVGDDEWVVLAPMKVEGRIEAMRWGGLRWVPLEPLIGPMEWNVVWSRTDGVLFY